MPSFKTRSVAEITRQDVQNWFSSLYEKHAAANRSLSILSLIMNQAEIYGHRSLGSNPCFRFRRYPCLGRERILTPEEIHRLGTALEAHESDSRLPVSIIRLLILTGCRQSEIRTLRWSEYRIGHLFLRDSKTGPRTVWLSSAAHSVLDKLPRESTRIFPSFRKGRPLVSGNALPHLASRTGRLWYS